MTIWVHNTITQQVTTE